MPKDNSPFATTGFVQPGRAYRLLTLGVTPPTPIGSGAETVTTMVIIKPAAMALRPTIPMSPAVSHPRTTPQRRNHGRP